MSRGPALDVIQSLNERIAGLERECNEARGKLDLARLLLHALGRIAVQRESEQVISATLVTAYELLGFERAIFFTSERTGPRVARALERGEDLPAVNVGVSPASAASFSMACLGVLVSGDADDLSAPIVDVRRRYYLSALLHGHEPYGFLYADGPDRLDASDGEMLGNLSAIAAVASRNASRLEEAQNLAARDSLTGLLNRRTLEESVAQQLVFCRRHGTSLVYLLLDVDNFKEINDRSGHAAGDAHLRRLADALVAMSRADDIVARYAGDEFVIVQSNPEPKIERFGVARISELLGLQGLRCTLGAAVYPRDGLDANTLFAAADRALYEAKRAGKNGFAFA